VSGGGENYAREFTKDQREDAAAGSGNTVQDADIDSIWDNDLASRF
jgi:hypothetical protein